MDYYKSIFKRKSFHFFVGGEPLTKDDLDSIGEFIKNVTPLYPDIKTDIRIVNESETTCHRGADRCILFYSEPKGEYLRNIGYIGEQIDLYLNSIGIGALWFGIGKPKEIRKDGLEYVIMIAIKRMPSNGFRKDMFKSKRKPLDEIWSGDDLGIGDIVRFSPSACNTQPWFVRNEGNELSVFRYKKPGKRGIMPTDKVMFYNKIDIGIFLFVLEVCLKEKGIRSLALDINSINGLTDKYIKNINSVLLIFMLSFVSVLIYSILMTSATIMLDISLKRRDRAIMRISGYGFFSRHIGTVITISLSYLAPMLLASGILKGRNILKICAAVCIMFIAEFILFSAAAAICLCQ